MTANAKKLTAKQQMFVKEFLVDLNATAACIRAGYSKRTADRIGPELLGKAWVADAIQKGMDRRSAKVDVTAEMVITELAYMAFYDPVDIASAGINKPADISKLPVQVRKAIIGWSWDKFGNFCLKLSPKTPSQELLGRHLKLFTDKVEHSGFVSQEPLPPEEAMARLRARLEAENAAGKP